MLRGLITAFRTLSILPLPGKDHHHMSGALPWFPVVGFFIGLSLYTTALILQSNITEWPQVTAIFILILNVILTRGLHLDGLADWADGFFGGSTREKTLAIMKDSFVGAFGMISLILNFLAKWIFITKILELQYLLFLISIPVISRTIQVGLMVCLPYARSNEGTAHPFVTDAKIHHLLGALGGCGLILFLIHHWSGFVLLSFAAVLGGLLGWWFFRRVRGITGDLLGASNEMIEGLLFFICAVGVIK